MIKNSFPRNFKMYECCEPPLRVSLLFYNYRIVFFENKNRMRWLALHGCSSAIKRDLIKQINEGSDIHYVGGNEKNPNGLRLMTYVGSALRVVHKLF